MTQLFIFLLYPSLDGEVLTLCLAHGLSEDLGSNFISSNLVSSSTKWNVIVSISKGGSED